MKITKPIASHRPVFKQVLPSPKLFSASIRHLLAMTVLLCAINASTAAPQLIWDPNQTGGVTPGGSGNWDTTVGNTVWFNGTNDVAWTQLANNTGALNGALFNGAGGTVTLDGTQITVTNNFLINSSGYTFASGAGNIYVTTNATLSVASGVSVTFNCNMGGSATAPSWQLGTGSTMNVGGNLLSSQQLVLGGPSGSAINLTGPSSTPGIMRILAPVNVTAGSLIPTSSTYIGYEDTAVTPYTNGILTVSGSSTIVTINGNILIIGRGNGTGTLAVQNGTVSVGNLTAARPLAIDYDGSANSSGTVNVSGGTLNVGSSSQTGNQIVFFDSGVSTSTATGLLTQSGGTINTYGIEFGVGGGTGSATLTQTAGALYVGPLGITKGASYTGPYSITLSGGTVGALAGNWSSSLPMTLGTTGGNVTFQCGGANGDFNIALSGPLTDGGLGGGLYVTGGGGGNTGMLTLSGANNYSGSTVVSNGTLAIVTSATPMISGPVTLDASTGSPTVTISPGPGQYWTNNGTLTVQNASGGTPALGFQFGVLPPSPTVAPIQVNGNVVFGSGATPNVVIGGSSLAVGTYPLIKYTGSFSGTLPSGGQLTFTGSASAGLIVNKAATKTISLVITTSTYNPALYWAVGPSGNWDIGITANWKSNNVSATYAEGDAVVFDDSAVASPPAGYVDTVTLNNTTVNPSQVTFNNANIAYTITNVGTSAIANSADTLSFLGTGTNTLTGANTYAGGTTLSAGQLNINNGGTATSSAIGTGTLTINPGATIDNTSGSDVTLQPTIPEIWNGNFTYAGSVHNFNTGAGGVTMNGNLTLAVNAENFVVGGAISDNSDNYILNKTGNGTLTLATGNSFGGGLTLTGGQVNLGDPNAPGTGIMTINGGTTVDNSSGGLLNLSLPAYAVNGSFTFLGSSSLDLGFGTITIPSGGSVIVDVVTNTLENDGNITSGNTRVIKSGNGTWIMGGRTSSGNNLQLEVSAGTVQMAKVSGQTIGYGTIGLTVDAGALAIDENSQQISSDSVVTPVPVNLPGGTLDLNGFSENVDNIFISNGGTIQDSGASGTTSILNIIYGNGRMATLTGTNCQFNVVNSGATLTFEGPIGGSGSLVSIGAGTLNLESNNTYTGSTVISNGTLALPNAGSISNSSNIILLTPNTALDLSNNTNTPNTGALSLQNGQTLSGFGTVTGMVITVTGATVAPGSATAVGTLLATGVGANTLGGTALMKLDAGHATNDQLSVGGSLAYGGTLALTNLSGTLVAGKSFTLFQAAGGYSGTFANITPSRPGFPDFGLAWNTNNLAVDGILSVVTSPVPPPPTITNISFSGGMLTIKGTRGLPNEPFLLQESANVGLTPLSAWTTVATGNFDANGNFTVSITPAGAPEFFVVWMQ